MDKYAEILGKMGFLPEVTQLVSDKKEKKASQMEVLSLL